MDTNRSVTTKNTYYIAIKYNNNIGILESRFILNKDHKIKLADTYSNEYDRLLDCLYKQISLIETTTGEDTLASINYLDTLVVSNNTTTFEKFYNNIKPYFIKYENIYYIKFKNDLIDVKDTKIDHTPVIQIELALSDLLYELSHYQN